MPRQPGATNFTPQWNFAGSSIQYYNSLNSTYGFLSTGSELIQVVFVETNGDDATAIVGNSSFPFETIDAALVASAAYNFTIIKIGIGDFTTPTQSNLRANLAIIGSGKPITNSTYTFTTWGVNPTITAPTALINGTVIKGGMNFVNKANVKVKDLGVDVGSAWCTAFNSGLPSDALVFKQATGSASMDGLHSVPSANPPVVGVEVDNVSTLGQNATALAHGILAENVINPIIINCSTYYNEAGIVVKSVGGNISNNDANGHGTYGFIIKSNDYAFSYDINVVNTTINSIIGNDGAGFLLAGENTTMGNVNISNLFVKNTVYGFYTSGVIKKFNLSSFIFKDINGAGLNLVGNITHAQISNGQLHNTNGIAVTMNLVSTDGVSSLRNITVDGATTAFSLQSASSNIYTTGLRVVTATTAYTLGANIYGTNNSALSGSSTGDFLSDPVTLASTAPQLAFKNTAAGSNGKLWDFVTSSGGAFSLRAVNDANTAYNTAIQIDRSGYVPSGISIKPPLNLTALAGIGDRVAYVDAAGNVGSAIIGSGLSLTGGTISATGGSSGTVSGSGTAGYVAKWSGASAQGNSIIQDNGTSLNVGGSSTAAGVGTAHLFNTQLMSLGASSGYFWSDRANTPTSTTNWYGWYSTGGNTHLYNGNANIFSISNSGAITASNLLSGTYTPTITTISGSTSSITAYKCQYSRVGNIVTVFGRVDCTKSAGAGSVAVSITLPIASNLAAASDLNGIANSYATGTVLANLIADTAGDTATLTSVPVTASTAHQFFFSFSYEVL